MMDCTAEMSAREGQSCREEDGSRNTLPAGLATVVFLTMLTERKSLVKPRNIHREAYTTLTK